MRRCHGPWPVRPYRQAAGNGMKRSFKRGYLQSVGNQQITGVGLSELAGLHYLPAIADLEQGNPRPSRSK